ncbi:hypothetical protein [Sedimenticola selenatireducens]|uniref:hypothetical protein n=1 Tax=Sedimenticola selenatireducens TaxID=191960 RepID=UPI0012F9C3FD|nr:hypothetical protein [Sedimenticola selenatireducens]
MTLESPLSGRNRHYRWANIQPRHFSITARRVGFNEKTAQQLFVEMMDSVDEVIGRVSGLIPGDFPDHIVGPVFDGMRSVRDRSVA